jgi:DNA-binding ferritin-like protein
MMGDQLQKSLTEFADFLAERAPASLGQTASLNMRVAVQQTPTKECDSPDRKRNKSTLSRQKSLTKERVRVNNQSKTKSTSW